jgi:hypothetical protein
MLERCACGDIAPTGLTGLFCIAPPRFGAAAERCDQADLR